MNGFSNIRFMIQSTEGPIVEIKEGKLDHLKEGSKKNIADGIFRIEKTKDDSGKHMLDAKKVKMPIDGHSFIRIQYEKSTSFVFVDSEERLLALSFSNKNKNLQKLEKTITEVAKLGEFGSIQDETLSNHLNSNYPEADSSKKEIYDNPSVLGMIGMGLGSIFGKFDALTYNSRENLNHPMAGKVHDSTSQHTSQRRATISEGVEGKPKEGKLQKLNTKASKLSSKIGESWDKSENILISSLRNFGKAFQDRINEGYCKSNPISNEQPKAQELKEQQGKDQQVKDQQGKDKQLQEEPQIQENTEVELNAVKAAQN